MSAPSSGSESNEAKKRRFFFEYVGYPSDHPKVKQGHLSLTTIEAFTGRDADTGERLFPDVKDRQHRFARLCVDLIIESTVEEALKNKVPLESLLDEQNPLISLPKGYTLPQLRDKFDKSVDSNAFTGWLVSQKNANGQSCVRSIEDDMNYRDAEARFDKALNTHKREFKGGHTTEPAPIHPWQRFVSRHPIISSYYDINIPEPKANSSAQIKRKSQGSDAVVQKLKELEEKSAGIGSEMRRKDRRSDGIKHLPVGSLSDINRLSIIPIKPHLAEVFFRRLNYYHNEGHAPKNDEDRKDFHRSPLKMGPHGLHDQKNYVALTEDVSSIAHARGIYGTIAELACLSPEQNAARKKTSPIYTAQRKLEGADHRFTVEHLTQETIESLDKDYARFHASLTSMLVLQERLSESDKASILGLLKPQNPISTYTNLNERERKGPAAEALLEYCMRDAYHDFSVMQRAIHTIHAANSKAVEWRQAWLSAACEFNEKCKATPEGQRCFEPVEDVFLNLVAGKDLSVAKTQKAAAKQARSL